MTWTQRLQESLLAAVMAAGTTMGGLLAFEQTEMRVMIGLTLLNAFGAFGAGMGINSQLSEWRQRRHRVN